MSAACSGRCMNAIFSPSSPRLSGIPRALRRPGGCRDARAWNGSAVPTRFRGISSGRAPFANSAGFSPSGPASGFSPGLKPGGSASIPFMGIWMATWPAGWGGWPGMAGSGRSTAMRTAALRASDGLGTLAWPAFMTCRSPIGRRRGGWCGRKRSGCRRGRPPSPERGTATKRCAARRRNCRSRTRFFVRVDSWRTRCPPGRGRQKRSSWRHSARPPARRRTCRQRPDPMPQNCASSSPAA
jgi:hypothetical protein